MPRHPVLPTLDRSSPGAQGPLAIFSIFFQELPRAPLQSSLLATEKGTKGQVDSEGTGSWWPHLSLLGPEGQTAQAHL